MSTKPICIGIHVHQQPERLGATLDSVFQHTAPTAQVILLPDGPDAMMRQALRSMNDLRQFGTEEPLGPPACFNRLVSQAEAAIYVLLESGAVVGPDWLTYLLAALEADPTHGLAGPSTNRAWNEQGVFPHGLGTPAQIARTAATARQRFGSSWRTLEPLYSLADFCYVVRREVVEAIGAADERYGLGPCWEMDYNIRAARVGFKGIWAGGAYVYRHPFTARRRTAEGQHFTANKQRYQDKFCALHLRGQRTDYETHCRGDACEHFAPTDLIPISLPLKLGEQKQKTLPLPVPRARSASKSTAGGLTRPSHTADKLQPEAGVTPLNFGPIQPDQPPLVSCIMPTRDRPDFVLQSIRYFQQQDYPHRELIIVDDGPTGLQQQLPDDPRIRYVHLSAGRSIGAKRNYACSLAQGRFIAQWDDDDWYAPNRLSAQVAPILTGAIDISGLTGTIFFDLEAWAFWGCTPRLHQRLFVEDVHGGTLVYDRRVWEKLAQYPDRSLAEDAFFLRQALRRGARMHRLANDHLFIYLRHATNSWSFRCGHFLDGQGWQRLAEPDLSPADRAFYAAHSKVSSIPAASRQPKQPHIAQPLVSCIMPTANRRPYVQQAIHYFLRQDYPHRELIIVDDGQDCIHDLVPADDRVRYIRLDQRHTIGAKRNLACREAAGDIIAHWDDDDWNAPWRLTYQVARLQTEKADICGLDRILFFDPTRRQAWQYVYPRHSRPWVYGCTLCYTKSFWQKQPFPNLNVGEDTRFVWQGHFKKIAALDNYQFFVSLVHAANTSPKQTRGSRWQTSTPDQIHELMGQDWDFYTGQPSE